MAEPTKEDRHLAWEILKDLSDRNGVPEWLGNDGDHAAKDIANDLALLIANHRELGSLRSGEEK